MRIAFDAGDLSAAAIAGLADPLAAAAREGHELWVAFQIGDAPRRDALLQLCADAAVTAHVVGYELPDAANGETAAARSAIRAHFFDALGVDRIVGGDVRLPHAPAPARLRLALVSPLPPLKSGVAFHAADLALLLQRDHDVELVTAQPDVDDPRLSGFAVRTPAWFRSHADEFDEVVYQVGNSRAHEFVFALLDEHPGIVVLHDVYLSNVLAELDLAGVRRPLVRDLYESHGWPAVADLTRLGPEATIWKYPASASIIARAARVVVHSPYALAVVRGWWGADFAAHCTVVPLLRDFATTPSREEARAALGVADDDFLVCSFGLLGPTKCNLELLQAFQESQLARDERCRLVFVGQVAHDDYGAGMEEAVASHRPQGRVHITGFVDSPRYSLYLAACDLAVQLRRLSRGETSAAVLDCLGHGVATIVNAHGSAADLPGDVAATIADEFTSGELAGALERLRGDAALRRQLSLAAAAYVRSAHSPRAVAEGYRDAIVHARRSPAAAERRLLRVAPFAGGTTTESLHAAATCIAANQWGPAPRQWLVDVSAMVHTDLGTGIQRVVRELAREWLSAPPAGYRVEPVYSLSPGMPWRYARRFAAVHAGAPLGVLEDAVAELRPGDVFVGVDLNPILIARNEPLLLRMRERGVKIVFALYDLLPVRMPHAFPPGADATFGSWLRTVARVADNVVAISRASAEDFAAWVADNPPERSAVLDIGFFPLGVDPAGHSTARLGWRDACAVALAAAHPALLMVGTVEPRKGHAQALAAVEELWGRGVDVNLVIVGKPGWMTQELVSRLRSHPERNRRLFWFDHAADATLAGLYEHCAALLAASHGEGFGLPLVEAAQRGLPLIARDLPVFREVAGSDAFYFSGAEPESLAAAIERWLVLRARGEHPRPQGVRRWSWRESARSFEEAALEGRSITQWSPSLRRLR